MSNDTAVEVLSQDVPSGHIHWFTLTVKTWSPAAVPPGERCQAAFWQFDWRDAGGFNGYEHSVVDDLTGARVAWGMPGLATPRPMATVSLPGQATDVLGPDYILSVVRVLRSEGYEVTCPRLDAAMDFDVGMLPQEFHDRVKAGEAWTAARWRGRHLTLILDCEEVDERGERGTETFYLGSKSSMRRLCFYDKHGFTRAELRMRDKWGNRALDALLAGAFSVPGVIRDFFDLPGNEKWEQICAGVPALALKACSSMPVLAAAKVAKVKAVLHHQYGRWLLMLALAAKLAGEDLAKEWMGDEAMDRLERRDIDLVVLAAGASP